MLGQRTLPCPDGRNLSLDDDSGLVLLNGQPLLRCRRQADQWFLELLGDPALALWAFGYWQFSQADAPEQVSIVLEHGAINAVPLGLLHLHGDGVWQLDRSMFWQRPWPWQQGNASEGFPQRFVMTGEKRHPRRPPKPQGEVYRRFDTALGCWISLRALVVDQDLSLFHRWQNHPRVNAFWSEAGTVLEHQDYLANLAADPHVYPLIGCFDDQPFGYFEVYWAKEDRIAPFYAAADYDRGLHMLVGEERHRGPHKVRSWLPALVHHLFLADSRTQRVVAEPRADNARMIGYLQQLGFWQEKTFDFPHKRAALMVQSRERFFTECKLR